MSRPRTASTRLQPIADKGWRATWFRIIYHHDHPDERLFDLTLIALIVLSVLATVLGSVQTIMASLHGVFHGLEWVFTVAFTVEYLLRVSVVKQPLRYMRSFYGIIDLLAILPSYLELILAGSGHLMAIRVLRVLRIFRILKLYEYTRASQQMIDALYSSRSKIFVFLLSVLALTTVFGSIMYLVEGPENGFTSIPRSIYWAIVTMATVGFGDITPKTPLGQFITSGIIIVGYGIIAVPTGIYSAELINRMRQDKPAATGKYPVDCSRCGLHGHDADARYCRRCGEPLPEISND
ncbi:cyclic nucleotide-gated potassium channel [mine drainage metagenome]|uniref:Cyclic nucleotide-gated potassium channel n=1 Tax=mine drainage metagenome TaxID=410659 RepID=A0A1J5QHQ6_9ZZZZ